MLDQGPQIEYPENYEQKSICCFVVDVSSSMQGEPILQLNRGLQTFHQEILEDTHNSAVSNRLEIAVVEFSHEVHVAVPPGLASSFEMPELQVKGSTKLVDGVRQAIRLVQERKDWYKQTGQPYLRPWIILLTDGRPDGDQDINGLIAEIESATKNKQFMFLAIGVQGADMAFLNRISGYVSRGPELSKMSAMKLQGLKFVDFFQWVSASMSMVASSAEGDQVNLPSPNNWTEGFTI